MIDIGLNKITKSFGFGNILTEVTFDVHKGEIVSIIGPNGSGKSTLLNIISGLEKPDSGTISIRNGATIGLLKQIPDEQKDITVKEILQRNVKEITDIEEKLKRYETMMQTTDSKELEKILKSYGNLQEKFINMGGYAITEKIGRVITGFKIEKLLDNYYNDLSGGEKRVVSIASMMIKKYDILLLDEPTNHLDIDTLEWLENYLKNYDGTIVIVSHDRYFLDRISNKTILLEDGKIDIYYGNYTYYQEEYEKRQLLAFKNYKDQQKQIHAMKASIKKLREWGTMADNEIFFKRANSIEKKLDKMEKISKPKQDTKIPINFILNERSGKEVIKAKNLNIQYDNHIIFENANIQINYRDKACIIGPNGSGKSTLIKSILSNPNYIGTNAKIGYIPQEIKFDNDNETIYQIARRSYIGEESHLRASLAKFLFYGENVYKKVSSISGGEKVRLKLFCLICQDVNLLILDEPTNHIDISTREILEESLNEYPGTILFISHDRYFINKIATKTICIENKHLVEYSGNYDDYKQYKKN